MKIITEAVAKNVLKNMKKFHDEQVRCHSEYGMNFLDNLGRRNVIMSQAQEFFLANALMDNFPDVKNDDSRQNQQHAAQRKKTHKYGKTSEKRSQMIKMIRN